MPPYTPNCLPRTPTPPDTLLRSGRRTRHAPGGTRLVVFGGSRGRSRWSSGSSRRRRRIPSCCGAWSWCASALLGTSGCGQQEGRRHLVVETKRGSVSLVGDEAPRFTASSLISSFSVQAFTPKRKTMKSSYQAGGEPPLPCWFSKEYTSFLVGRCSRHRFHLGIAEVCDLI